MLQSAAWLSLALIFVLTATPFAVSDCVAGSSSEPLRVVVTIPVLKDFVEQVGGSHVKVTTLLNGYENEHTYSPRPSDLVAVRKARLLFEVGGGLEVWIGNLVKNAGSSTLKVITTSKGIDLVRDSGGEGHGHDHGAEWGNPHVWLDPQNAATMLRHITDALVQEDPDHAAVFRLQQTAYVKRLDRLQEDLLQRLRSVSERRIVVHHAAWPYFAKRFGFEIVGTIQTQSGSEPSAVQLQSLISTMRKGQIKVVVSEVQLNQKLPDLLGKETGARVVLLTTLPGGIPGTETYLDMLRYNVFQLAHALEAA